MQVSEPGHDFREEVETSGMLSVLDHVRSEINQFVWGLLTHGIKFGV
jgi:hypothetical protein